MLSSSSVQRASRPYPRDVLRLMGYGPRHLRSGNGCLTAGRPKSTLIRQMTLKNSDRSAYTQDSTSEKSRGLRPIKRLLSTSAIPDTNPDARKDAIYTLVDKIQQQEADIEVLLDELDLLDDYHTVLSSADVDLTQTLTQAVGHRDEQSLETWVRGARQQFGNTLPEGFLNATELQLYTRLYGEPIFREQDLELEEESEEGDLDQLLREDGEGGWEEVEFERSVEEEEEEIPVVYDMEVDPIEEESLAMQRTREIAEQLGGEIMLQQFEDEAVPDSHSRTHPLTDAGKFSAGSKTVYLPQDTVNGPVAAILSQYSNKHISEAAHRIFGGPHLPYSTRTPPPYLQLPHKPIPLKASQNFMGEMDANAFLSVLYPGIYASSLSVLSEVRKRLGTKWIRRLISKDGGPNVLDVGGGGAGILAWRDIIRAEWEVMVPDHPASAPIPMGRSTVVTGSEALKMRASTMLENTTFLPRLPDYVHVRGNPTLDDSRPAPKRKQFDIIVAPHTLLDIDEDYMRKEHVENLWSLLNPDGGVLILLEKGRQRGFEAIAGAREMLLKRHISSPGSTNYENLTESSDDNTVVNKETGMIVAPCTNHENCPMYHVAGNATGRKDYCHFQQRYIRPQYLQRIIGAKDKNHEDVSFSYIAVQRGVDLRQEEGILQGSQATDAAFDGYENLGNETAETSRAVIDEVEAATDSNNVPGTPDTATKQQGFNTLSLPRIVYPPMKRRGHVIFDFCTPTGTIERWTVPRSYSRQAYKDARKAQWGDLWALGAKTRVRRNLALGEKHGEGKKERLLRRAAAKAAANEGEGHEEIEEEQRGKGLQDIPIPTRKKGQNIPSWKKHADKKKVRQAQKKVVASGLPEDFY
ncbi:hypothetical protein ASPZODRAFT_127453 [Penicilliopsis zonata CBS 506.65]|uniref:37S ribosomal protein Rsm22 n=1 Tax=Penicilliopsis zonata CBS 506.65 TaxID=1073090 RepID=A0A1L9SWA6_9EURO|nr:hypothetical protein ASPZODRAFT_127453 [Penicilliopsis zonata CBS 506.65]OJJ51381.1 hypothetical protein ASPZODRAFT_127453 [Penicilliopsis zonata CBS 506.65]